MKIQISYTLLASTKNKSIGIRLFWKKWYLCIPTVLVTTVKILNWNLHFKYFTNPLLQSWIIKNILKQYYILVYSILYFSNTKLKIWWMKRVKIGLVFDLAFVSFPALLYPDWYIYYTYTVIEFTWLKSFMKHDCSDLFELPFLIYLCAFGLRKN